MNRNSRSAFTLIELLVVIAIIALLAGLIAGLGVGATRDKKEKLIETQLETLVTVLESYKKKHGFYPPSVGNPAVLADGDPDNDYLAYASPNLFYELTGAVVTDANGDGEPEGFFSADGTDSLSLADLAAYGIGGVINSGNDPRAVKDFYPGLMPSQVEVDPAPPGGAKPLRFLVVPADRSKSEKFNPWRYNSANPTNNPQSFDLWAEFVISDKPVIIGNWAQ